MTECPSRSAERYLADQERPEVCPICGKDNSTEDGKPVCVQAEDFCSVECRDEYCKNLKEIDQEMYYQR